MSLSLFLRCMATWLFIAGPALLILFWDRCNR
jgi:hypothetical protein